MLEPNRCVYPFVQSPGYFPPILSWPHQRRIHLLTLINTLMTKSSVPHNTFVNSSKNENISSTHVYTVIKVSLDSF